MTSKKPLGLRPVLLVAAALAAGAIVGAAAVYVKGMGSGNGRAVQADLTTPTGAECPITPVRKAALAAAAKGEVAAMAVADPPRQLDVLSFKGPDGKDRSLSDFSNKRLLLNIWATWCFPCREEMPALDRLQKAKGGNDFEVVAINIDTGGDEKPKTFLSETGIKSLGYYRDSSMGVFNALKKEGLAMGLPVTLLIDEKGCVLGSMNGPAKWDSADAAALIEAAAK